MFNFSCYSFHNANDVLLNKASIFHTMPNSLSCQSSILLELFAFDLAVSVLLEVLSFGCCYYHRASDKFEHPTESNIYCFEQVALFLSLRPNTRLPRLGLLHIRNCVHPLQLFIPHLHPIKYNFLHESRRRNLPRKSDSHAILPVKNAFFIDS